MLVAPQWISSSDPNLDVGFVVLNPHDGENIQRVLSAGRLGIDSGYPYLVRVTGNPACPGQGQRRAELPASRNLTTRPAGLTDLAGSMGLALPELLTRTGRFGHGTTIGTNAVLERTGARVGVIGLVVDGQPIVADESVINQYTYRLPHLDVRTTACGGGTIARREPQTGALRVGPDSAGAEPGPARYGRGGTQATVTDADVVLCSCAPIASWPDACRWTRARPGPWSGGWPTPWAWGWKRPRPA
jgi:Hydantoinase/oxoprolinase